jgi:competence protein ComEC
VNPRISVISAGKENPYGHPHPELLERLEEKGT